MAWSPETGNLRSFRLCFRLQPGGVMLQKKVHAVVLAAMVSIATVAVSAEAQRGQRVGGQRGAAAAGGPNYGSAAVEGTAQIKPDLYFVYGGGANTVIRVTPEGLIVADTKNPGAEISAALLAQIKTISTQP